MDDVSKGANPFDPVDMHSFLTKKLHDAAGLLWTVFVESLPIYVIRPEGPFARDAYERLIEFLSDKHAKAAKDRAEIIAVPGVITGQARLYNGMQVPVVNPDLRGLCNWTTGALIDAAHKAAAPAVKPSADELKRFAEEFLHRIYYELRNAGRTSRDRALNYAGTNLFTPIDLVLDKFKANHALDTIDVQPSTLCRPGSDCWDITLNFFDSTEPITNVRWHHRYTVDVSEVIPVMVGEIRSWKAR
jgi:cyanobactin maturation PatA/PatG family protease